MQPTCFFTRPQAGQEQTFLDDQRQHTPLLPQSPPVSSGFFAKQLEGITANKTPSNVRRGQKRDRPPLAPRTGATDAQESRAGAGTQLQRRAALHTQATQVAEPADAEKDEEIAAVAAGAEAEDRLLVSTQQQQPEVMQTLDVQADPAMQSAVEDLDSGSVPLALATTARANSPTRNMSLPKDATLETCALLWFFRGNISSV
jgi:hypothetical protein